MSTKSLVLQLQELSSSNDTEITELLRKALLVASKLGLEPLKNWANQELQGYGSTDIPNYRKVQAELKARNPVHGLISYIISDPELMAAVCNVSINEPVGSLVELLQADDSFLIVPLDPEQSALLMGLQDSNVKLEPTRTIGRNQVAGILDAVRTTILEWALKLEADGVSGEGMVFSSEEKAKAQASIRIENFQGILGDVSHSTVTQNQTMDIQKGDFEGLRKCLADEGVSPRDIEALEAAIKVDPPPSSGNQFGKTVSSWIGNMLAKAASGSWQIGVGAAGSLLSNAISAFYGL